MLQQLGLLDPVAGAWRLGDGDVTIRASRRAKRLTLKIVPPYRVELVVPRGTRPRAVENFLSENREWIRRAHAELESRYPPERRRLPGQIELAAIGCRWQVELRMDADAPARLGEGAGSLSLSVPTGGAGAGFELLRRWLVRKGREHLAPWLAREAQRVDVAPARVQIRTQRTRWGSCSQSGTISLNAALLLLPPRLVRYLLVHELCHLRHLDHSARYWRLVERHDPEFRANDRALAAAWSDIPAWALPR